MQMLAFATLRRPLQTIANREMWAQVSVLMGGHQPAALSPAA